MGCFDHSQEYIGTCMWCGKQLCSRCVARASGKKLYCHNCASNLGDVEIRHEYDPEPIETPVQKQARDQPMQLKSQVKPAAGKVPTIASLSEAKKIQPQQSQPIRQNSFSTASKPSSFSQSKTSAAPAQASSPAASSAARSALGMFAQQAMEQLEAEKKKKEVK